MVSFENPWAIIQDIAKSYHRSLKNSEGRQSAKSRQIAKQSTSRMRDHLGMVPVQFEMNPFQIVGLDVF